MDEPLTREQQIELMRDAPERVDARVERWLRTPEIRATLLRKPEG
jgi:hypothetical protein